MAPSGPSLTSTAPGKENPFLNIHRQLDGTRTKVFPDFLLPLDRPSIPCLFISLRTLLHFSAVAKITTLFFSWDCTLFEKKQGVRYPRRLGNVTRSKNGALAASRGHPVTGLPRPCRGHQSPVTTLLFIPQSAGSARTATRGRSTVHRSGIPCALPSPEFLRPDTYASFPSIWFRLRLA